MSMRPPDIIRLNNNQTMALVEVCSILQLQSTRDITIYSDRKDGAVDVVYGGKVYRLHKDTPEPELTRY